MDKPCVILGRFQPPHHGHFEVIKQLVQRHGQVYIVIVNLSKISSVNPLKSSESKMLLSKGLAEIGLTPQQVVLVRMRRPKRVTSNPDLWIYNEMARRLKRPFVFYTGNKSVMTALQGKPDVRPLNILSPREITATRIKNKRLSSTEIRRLIRAKLNWAHLLPKPVAEAIKKTGLVQRIRDTMGLKRIHKHRK